MGTVFLCPGGPTGSPGNDKHTLLLLHGDKIKDSSRYKVPLTNQGVVVSTAQSKFGGKSFHFGKGTRILFPQLPQLLNAPAFTLDWWEYCEPMSGTQGSRYTSAFGVFGGIQLGTALGTLYASSRKGAWDLASSVALSQTNYAWVHWAFVKKGLVINTYRDGILFKRFDLARDIWWDKNAQQSIGSTSTATNYDFLGYIDEFRISDIARWTSDFTPPTKPY